MFVCRHWRQVYKSSILYPVAVVSIHSNDANKYNISIKLLNGICVYIEFAKASQYNTKASHRIAMLSG